MYKFYPMPGRSANPAGPFMALPENLVSDIPALPQQFFFEMMSLTNQVSPA
jgi:hypothetical protein